MACWFLPQPVRSSQAAEPQFPHLENGNNTHFRGALILLNGVEHTKHVTHGKTCRSFLLSPLRTYGKGAQHWSPETEGERKEERQRQRLGGEGRGGRRRAEGRQTERVSDVLLAGLCPARLLCRWQEYRMGGLSLLQRNFPSQQLNLGLLHGRRIHYHLSRQGSLTEGAGSSNF